MSHHLARRPSFRLNLACAAFAALAFAGGCSKQDENAGTQAAADSSASAVAQGDLNNLPPTAAGTIPAATGTQPMPVHGSPAPTTSYADDGGNPSYASGGDIPTYDAGDGQSGAPESVVSTYIDPPLSEPAPVEVSWAPPPMLVEEPPPQPGPDYVWTGGYWAWQGQWVWCAGRWSEPPRAHYRWQEPYYEHRGDNVVYVPGYWSAPDANFVAPAVGIAIAAAIIAAGVHHGHAPDGPQGVFIPPPPGSRPGIIVPAPVGTPPAVVVGAPPVLRVGMRVEGGGERGREDRHATNVTNITNVRNVTIVAPQGTTANGQAFQRAVPAQAHLAAAQAPVVRVAAPEPTSKKAVPAWQPGHALASLPPAQQVHRPAPPATAQGRTPAGELMPPGARPDLQHAQGGPMAARPDPGQTRAQMEQQQRAQAEQQQQAQRGAAQARAQETAQEARQHAQQAQQQQAQQQAEQRNEQQQRAEQQQQQQRTQAEQQQQRTQQAEQQRAQQAARQRNQQEEQQRAQQQAQQRAQQEQRNEATQQHAQQAAQQRAQQAQQQQRAEQQQQQHAQQEQQQRAQQQAEQQRAKAEQEQRAKAEQERSDQSDKPADRREHPADKTNENDRQ